MLGQRWKRPKRAPQRTQALVAAAVVPQVVESILLIVRQEAVLWEALHPCAAHPAESRLTGASGRGNEEPARWTPTSSGAC